MDTSRKLSSSLEDYLEAIYHIEGRKQAARAKDIALRLKVKGASVTAALQALARLELINYAPYDVITLTDKGHAVAGEVVSRHQALHKFFAEVLGVEEETAQKAACRMEHALPDGILERLLMFVEVVGESGGQDGGVLEEFNSRLAANSK